MLSTEGLPNRNRPFSMEWEQKEVAGKQPCIVQNLTAPRNWKSFHHSYHYQKRKGTMGMHANCYPCGKSGVAKRTYCIVFLAEESYCCNPTFHRGMEIGLRAESERYPAFPLEDHNLLSDTAAMTQNWWLHISMGWLYRSSWQVGHNC